MFEQHFTLGRVGELVGKNPATLRTHINRGFVTGQGPRNANDKNKERGKHERFSVNSLIEFALAYRLEASGFGLELAFTYAGQFAHGGGSDFTAISKGKRVERLPGLPFHHQYGHTYMGMMAGQSAEVAGVSPDLAALRFHLGRMTGAPVSQPMTMMNMTAFFREICCALGADHRVVLDSVYGKEAVA